MENTEPEPPDKKNKSPRTLRREENKNTNEFVVKCGLNKSILKFKNEIENSIKKRVLYTSKASHKLSILINLYIRHTINKNPLKIKLTEDVFDVTFLFQLITGIERSNKPTKLAKEILENPIFSQFKCNTIRTKGDTNSLVTIASEYSKNFKVYLQENFKRKQIAFFKTYDRPTLLLFLVNGWEVKTPYVLTHLESKTIDFHRKVLGLSENEKVNKIWMKSNYSKIIIYFSMLSRRLKRKTGKENLLAPICKIKMSMIYIDKTVFKAILKEIKAPEINTDDVFDGVFNTKKFLTANQINCGFKFTGTIQTDSVAINFHFRRPNLPEKNSDFLNTKEERNSGKYRVIANDPGRTTLFCGVEKLENNKFKKYSLTRRQFYKETGIKEATKRSNKWNDTCLKDELLELSKTNSRSLYFKDFLKYVIVLKKYEEKFWNEASKKRHARQRFSIYSAKKSTYDRFFKSIFDPEKPTVIAYGDAGFASTSKYELSAPTSTLEKQCSKWFKIVKVDEFRTTKLNYLTGSVLCKVQEELCDSKGEAVFKKKSLRGLLWYKSTKDNCNYFVNRDFLNAAKNILNCYYSFPERPAGFSREDQIENSDFTKIIKRKIKPSGEIISRGPGLDRSDSVRLFHSLNFE